MSGYTFSEISLAADRNAAVVAYWRFRADCERARAARLSSAREARRLHRLDDAIATHVNATLAEMEMPALADSALEGVGLMRDAEFAGFTGWHVTAWRLCGDPNYENWRDDYQASRRLDAREREAEADARYYRLATLWTRSSVAALLLGLAALAVAHSPIFHSPVFAHFFGRLP